MTKTEKVNFVIKTLKNLYPEIPVPLDHKDPYTLLIAVLLSAQCTDVRVNQITPILFERADNPYDMVKLSVDEIRAIIRPCGLSPMKSKGIYGLSRILIEKFQGKVPQSFEALEALPAVAATRKHLLPISPLRPLPLRAKLPSPPRLQPHPRCPSSVRIRGRSFGRQ